MTFAIRDVTLNDAAAIAAIYKHYVENTTVSFEEVAPDADEVAARIQATLAGGFPYLVAEEGGRVVAYAYAGPFHKRSAYRFTVENTIYVAHTHPRQGLGRALTQQVIARCTEKGCRQMVALISGLPDSASVAMHASLGFRQVGYLPALGMKFGKWVDIIEMQLALGEGDTTIPR